MNQIRCRFDVQRWLKKNPFIVLQISSLISCRFMELKDDLSQHVFKHKQEYTQSVFLIIFFLTLHS